jgi:hypothetical protein
MAANGISTLPTKQAKQLAKLDIAQAKRKGYSAVVPAGSQEYDTVASNRFGSIKVVSDGSGSTYLVFLQTYPNIHTYLYVGAPLHRIRFAGNDHYDLASIAGPLVDCSTLSGFPQTGAVGYLLSVSLGVTNNNNVSLIDFPNGRFTSSGSADTSAPFYRVNNNYDITELPTQYNGNSITDNPNADGLIEGRPWTVSP